MTIEEFLLARIADAEKQLDQEGLSMRAWISINQILANQRFIIAWHKNWPVLVEGPEERSFESHPTDMSSYIYRASRQMASLTQAEYIKKFGTQPPTAPLLREMASMYADHPDFREEWK